MPLSVFVLACAVFVQATSEFMLAGLVTEIAATFAVPVATAGWCTSAFALGMVVGAPLMALGARRLPPRTALATFLVVFAAVHGVGAATPSFAVLLGSRVVAALANAGFLAVALGVAVRSVPPERTARATGLILAGSTLALIAGVPLGALVGGVSGWRTTFAVVAGLAGLAVLGVVAVRMPLAVSGSARPSVRAEVRVLRRPAVALTLLVAVLVNAATFAAYTYLGPLLTDAAGLPAATVPLGLALFGTGALLGVLVASRTADTRYALLLALGGGALVAGWVALALLARTGPAALALVGATGVAAFAVGSGVISRALALTPDALTLGGAATTAALNVGATVGPVLGGAGLTAGPTAPAWVAAALVALAAAPAALGGLAGPGLRTRSGSAATGRGPRRARGSGPRLGA